MAYLIESSEFVDSILRIDVNTLVKGYDGVEMGPSNEQAIALANRTVWLKEFIESIKTIIDNAPDPEKIMDNHIQSDSPHPQYITEDEGGELFVKADKGNLPNGYLQLDEKGLFPASLAKLYEARYVVTENETDRLSLSDSKNVTICFQRDDNRIYYLNPGEDPSVKDNWLEGEEQTDIPLVSVFGRIGEVIAQEGDYNADQITETDKRKFVTDSEKSSWNKKQQKLESGTNIKTVCGVNLLDSGDVSISQLKGFSNQVNTSLLAGNNITLNFDPAKNKTIISAKVDEKEGSKLVINDEEVTEENKEYTYKVLNRLNFDYIAHASKRIDLKEESTDVIDYTTNPIRIEYNELPEIDSRGLFINGDVLSIPMTESTDSSVEGGITDELDIASLPEDSTSIDITVDNDYGSIIPVFAEQSPINGYLPFSSPVWSTYEPYWAFAEPLTEKERKKIPYNKYWSDKQVWYGHSNDVYIGIKNTSNPFFVTGYGFQYFESFAWSSTSSPPTEWIFQGRNNDIDDWVDLDKQTGQELYKSGDGWFIYNLSKPAYYKQYRILINNIELRTARACVSRIRFYNTLGALLKDDNGQYYTVDDEGMVNEVSVSSDTDFTKNQFVTTPTPIKFSNVSSLLPLKICSLKPINVNITPFKQALSIAIDGDMIEKIELDGLDDFTISDPEQREMKYAVTPDGEYCYIWDNGQWTSIGPLANDDASAKLVYEKGMSLDTINSVSHEAWLDFSSIVENARIGLVTTVMLDNATEHRLPDTVTIHFSQTYGWQRMSEDSVKIVLTYGDISFTPSETGTYRFCYRFN